MLEALGLIEVVGLVGAIEAADTASKAADVKVIGYELTRGSGMVVVIIAVAVPCNIAAPMPCKPRKVINSTTLFENPHKIEDIKNTVSPIL